MASRAGSARPKRTLVIAAWGLALAYAGVAQDLRLDPTFGTGGIVTDTSFNMLWFRCLVQPDEKILVAGLFSPPTPAGIARFLSTGSPDPAFVVPTLPIDMVTGLALQADGKILLAGSSFQQGFFTLVRLMENGTPDPSFDGDGVVTTFSSSDYSRGVVVQSDGRIVAAGYELTSGRMLLARYLTSGALDSTFGTNGTVLGPASGGAERVILDSQGRIVVDDGQHQLVRFLPGGAPDPGFGDQGVVTLPEDYFVTAIAIAGNDAVLVVGNSFSEIFLEKYNANGVLDSSFGDGGQVRLGIHTLRNEAYGAAVLPDGRFYVAATWTGAFFLGRFLENGQFDPPFGIDGFLLTTIADFAVPRDLVVQSDGSVVLIGSSNDFATSISPSLARYVACTAPSAPPPAISSVQPEDVVSNDVVFEIAGTDIDAAAEIRVGQAAGFVVGSPTPGTIEVEAFGHPFGYVDVVVRNVDCQAVTLTDAIYLSPQDVPLASPYFPFVKRLTINGVTGGCGPLNFCGNFSVTRAEMAVFLLRSKEGASYEPPAATGTFFTDVPIDGFAAAWIEELSRRAITGGCGANLYCPDFPNTRAEMAVFLLVTLEGTGYQPPDATGVFSDVPASSPFARWVEELSGRGITAGCGPGLYCPDNPVLREQMAVFLSVTFSLPG